MRRRKRQGGFTPVEVMIAIVILGVVAGGLAQGLALTSASLGDARVQSLATGLATSALEDVKRIPYADLGTVGGDPVGAIDPDRTAVVDALELRVQTQVTLVDGSGASGAEGAVAYKRVTVTVTPPRAAAVTASTIVTPAGPAAGAGAASVAVTVTDHAGEPVPGLTATLTLDDAPAGIAVTDAGGVVTFAALPADRLARVGVAGEGYLTTRADRPDRLFKLLRQGRAWEPAIRVYRAHTVAVELVDAGTGAPVTEAAAITLTAPDGGVASATTLAGGATFATVADPGGANPRQIEPSASTAFSATATADCHLPGQATGLVPAPESATPSGTITVPLTRAPGGAVTVTVLRGDGTAIAGAQVVVQGGGPGLAPVTRAADASGVARFCLPPSGATAYAVSANVNGYLAAGPASVSDGGAAALTLVQPGAITLQSGLLGGQVRLRLQDGTPFREQGSALVTGLSIFADVPPGTYRAAARGLLGWGPDRLVEVRSGEHLGPVSV